MIKFPNSIRKIKEKSENEKRKKLVNKASPFSLSITPHIKPLHLFPHTTIFSLSLSLSHIFSLIFHFLFHFPHKTNNASNQHRRYNNINMTEEEEWVKTAMSDDSIVVEMLLRLHQAEPRPAPRLAPRKKGAAPVLQLEWSVRQRRSRQKVRRKKGDATRASPTTPLSWSGATSVSGGAADGGFEESSKPSKPIDNARSKVCFCVFLCVFLILSHRRF